MNKFLFIGIILLALTACNSNNRFEIKGEITNAAKEKMYLEHIGLMKVIQLDSVVLSDKGSFKFKAPRPAFPDFYRLRINNKTIDFAVDSCETISVNADFKNFSTDYKIEGSHQSVDIQKLRKSVSAIQLKANGLNPEMSAEERNAKITEITSDIEKHKAMARQLILQNPRSTTAYFAIYQKINDTYLFSPYVKEDRPFCAAVATSYNAFMPDYERTKNLYALVMDAIKTERNQKTNQAWAEIMRNASTGYIDIALKDRTDKVRKLSELEGKLVIIDFSSYEMENNIQYTFELRELYNKYHNRGLEIFQISLDKSKLVWEGATTNIPWVCVRDENGPNTPSVATYNVSSIPTLFLLNRKGVITGRYYDFKSLEDQIKKLL